MPKDIKKAVRFSTDEYKIIERKLIDNNISFSVFARNALLNQKIKFPFEKSMLYELNKIYLKLESIASNNREHKKNLYLLLDIENKLNELI